LPRNASADRLALAPQADRASAVQAAVVEQRRSILVVDDNRDAADLLAATLEILEHEVRVAYDGPTALRLASEHPPDVALLDIGLPVIDGYELARRLHEHPALENLPLLAITGYGQEGDRRRSREAGFSAHLVKPVDLQEMQSLLGSLTPHGSR